MIVASLLPIIDQSTLGMHLSQLCAGNNCAPRDALWSARLNTQVTNALPKILVKHKLGCFARQKAKQQQIYPTPEQPRLSLCLKDLAELSEASPSSERGGIRGTRTSH
jgi:hypothetical protein